MSDFGAQENGLISPYRRFTRAEWASLRADTPLTLTIDDLTRLKSVGDPISLEEVIEIYLPLSRLLALYVAATQGLFKATQRFLDAEDGKVPYIIGVAGPSPSANPRRRASSRRCSRAGPIRRKSSSSRPTVFFSRTPFSSAKA